MLGSLAQRSGATAMMQQRRVLITGAGSGQIVPAIKRIAVKLMAGALT